MLWVGSEGKTVVKLVTIKQAQVNSTRFKQLRNSTKMTSKFSGK